MLGRVDMVRIEVGFTPTGFEKRMVKQTKKDVAARLQAYDLDNVKVILKKLPDGRLVFKFLGEEYDVDKVKGLLGIC